VICCESYPRRFRLSIDFSHEINPAHPAPNPPEACRDKASGAITGIINWTSIRPKFISMKNMEYLETLAVQRFQGTSTTIILQAAVARRRSIKVHSEPPNGSRQMNRTRLK
jgi:hypothetical protein